MSTAALTTKVRNMSGKTKPFSFLPPHGKTLVDGEEYTFDGDIRFLMGRHKRRMKSLNDALVRGDLVIVHTPPDHFYDATLDTTKVVDIDNNTVATADPSWGAYSSSV